MNSDQQIIEGIVTTINRQGECNIAPMGPIVDPSFETLVLRPFCSSTTFTNLNATKQGVFHVVDDVLLLAQAAIGQFESIPEQRAASVIDGSVLKNSCRWYEFRIVSNDQQEPRSTMVAEVVHVGRQRDFIGFNRAKHAVVEAAILATRVGVLPAIEIQEELERLAPWVKKTASDQERRAYSLLINYIIENLKI